MSRSSETGSPVDQNCKAEVQGTDAAETVDLAAAGGDSLEEAAGEGVDEMFNLADPDDLENKLDHLNDAEMDALLQQAYKINQALKAELARQGNAAGAQCVRVGSSPVLPPIPKAKPPAKAAAEAGSHRGRTNSKSAH